MAVCAICGEKLGIFDRELCTDGFICKKCRSFFSDFKVDYKTASIKSMKEQRAFFKERQERAKGFEDLQDPGHNGCLCKSGTTTYDSERHSGMVHFR